MATAIRKQVDDTEARLRRLIDQAEPRLRATFTSIVNQLTDQFTLTQLADFIEQGNIQAALEAAGRAGAQFATAINGVFIVSGESQADFFRRRLEVIIDFDQTNFRAIRFMQADRLRLIREFTVEQTAATQEALRDGIRRGLNPRDQARNFRSSIGLTARQTQAVNNFRRLLDENSSEALTRQLRDRRFDSTVRRAIGAGEPLSTDQVDRMTDRYRERFLRYRSEVIARTEALRAVHAGSEEMYEQAFDQGLVDPQNVVRTWNTATDGRVRDHHTTMNGQERRPGEPFVSGNGNALRHPGDIEAPAEETIQCRCVIGTRIV